MASPSIVAGCRLIERIGAGAKSLIFRACELATGRIVAVKYLDLDNKEAKKYLRHIRNEYHVLRTLRNGSKRSPMEGIVKVYRLVRKGFMRSRKEYALVMQYVDGPDLRRENRYPLGQIVDILTQVAKAVSVIHNQGYIHGDLKPENIVISHDGHATIVDFGFACKAGTLATSIRGTRDYLAPEQLSKGYLTEKTDIYNFGASMYFLLTGRHIPAVVPAQDETALFISRSKAKAPPMRSFRPEVPAPLEAITMRCLEKEPIARPSCIEEVLATLSEVRSTFLT